MIEFSLNGKNVSAEVDGATPLLWVLRDTLGLMGTKYGCGVAQCGACTVHVDGQPQRSCVLSAQSVAGKSVMTIEGLSPDRSHALQKAWMVPMTVIVFSFMAQIKRLKRLADT